MNPVYLRVLSYIALPILGALFAALSNMIDGVSYDAASQIVTISLPTLVKSMISGGVIAAGVFAKWGRDRVLTNG